MVASSSAVDTQEKCPNLTSAHEVVMWVIDKAIPYFALSVGWEKGRFLNIGLAGQCGWDGASNTQATAVVQIVPDCIESSMVMG